MQAGIINPPMEVIHSSIQDVGRLHISISRPREHAMTPPPASLIQQRTPREQRDDVHASRFDGLAAAFLAIHEHQAERDVSTFALNGVDGFESGAAGGDDVIHDDHVVAGLEIALDLFACAMALRLLADGKNLKGFGGIFRRRGHPDGEGNRVGPESHAADGVDLELLGMDLRADGMPAEIADEQGSERIERGHPAVDVEIALLAGSEGEAAGADRFLKQKFFQSGGGLEHGGIMAQMRKN